MEQGKYTGLFDRKYGMLFDGVYMGKDILFSIYTSPLVPKGSSLKVGMNILIISIAEALKPNTPELL